MGLLQHQRSLAFVTIVAAGGGFACRSKLEVKTTGSGRTAADCSTGTTTLADSTTCAPPEPTNTSTSTEPQAEPPPEEPVPQELADMLLLQGPKKYFQTRDVITVRIPAAMIDGGDFYRILNVTKEEEGEEPLILLDEAIDADTQALRSSYRRNQRMALVRQGDEYLFAFYPGQTGWAGRFFYGVNKLRLVVDDVEQPRFSNLELTLRDFEVFGMAITAFPNNVQVAVGEGYQFQGWVNVLSPAIAEVKDETGKVTSKLVHGVFNMVNPH